ncbi:MAG TPA: hypothetical protein DER23_07805 [Clostridiales bacterium]|jgi:uncharacterized protein (UPF0371 family)|nr:hypothetical protein [Clostridiales bacterium]
MKIGFDNEKYVSMQSERILERIKQNGNKLYLEFGGKLFDDLHAARVLPGFAPDAKIRILQKLKDQTEIIFVINAGDIERKKMRADFGISYEMDVLRLIDHLRAIHILVSSIVITRYNGQPSADIFKKKLAIRGERVYVHNTIKGYPNDVDTIVSENGYGANEYIETTRPLVVVTAPGPGSGKMATCLSQLYHEHKRNMQAGYAKFETFPIWNLPLKHPVNLAYEAATADLHDMNMIDPYHLEAYGVTTVNYNRDIEAFPVLKTILQRITGTEHSYRSPTDMGVNMAGYGICDDHVCREAAKQEIVRRYYKAWCDFKNGLVDIDVAHRVEMLMKEVDADVSIRPVVAAAQNKTAEKGVHAMAIQMPDGKIITGRTIEVLGAPASAVINALKYLAGIGDDLLLISPSVLIPILDLKHSAFGSSKQKLNLEEALIALAICAVTNPIVEKAMEQLPKLRGLEAHYTKMANSHDEEVFRKLKINLTCEPEFSTKNLYSE